MFIPSFDYDVVAVHSVVFLFKDGKYFDIAIAVPGLQGNNLVLGDRLKELQSELAGSSRKGK